MVNALNKHSDENLDDSENAGAEDQKPDDNEDTATKDATDVTTLSTGSVIQDVTHPAKIISP